MIKRLKSSVGLVARRPQAQCRNRDRQNENPFQDSMIDAATFQTDRNRPTQKGHAARPLSHPVAPSMLIRRDSTPIGFDSHVRRAMPTATGAHSMPSPDPKSRPVLRIIDTSVIPDTTPPTGMRLTSRMFGKRPHHSTPVDTQKVSPPHSSIRCNLRTNPATTSGEIRNCVWPRSDFRFAKEDLGQHGNGLPATLDGI